MTEVKKTVDATAKKPVEAPKKIEAPAPMKAVEAPKPAAAPKAAAVKKAAAPKKAAAKKDAPKKAVPAKKDAPKKAAAPAKKSVAPKDVKVNVLVEHHGRQISADTIVKTAEKLWTMAGHDAAKISKVELYVKQEDGAVYCVVNGEAVGKYDL